MSTNKDGKAYVNLEAGLGRVRGNKKIFGRMLGLFLKSTEFDAFEEAIAAGDKEKASELAHAIKGMTGNLGLDAVFTESETLMTQLRAGTQDDALIGQFREDYAETRRQVEALLPEME